MAETQSSFSAGDPSRILAYIGSDSAYFEEWRRHLVAPGDPWTALRLGDADSLDAAGPVAAVFVDTLAPPAGVEPLRLTLRKNHPELPVVLLTGLTPSLEDEAGWGAFDSIYRLDWIRLQSLARWIHLVRDRAAGGQDRDELRRARDTLQAFLGAVPSAITVLAKDGKMVYANLEAARVMGFPSVEDLLNTDPRQVVERFEILDEHGHPFPTERLPNRLAFQGTGPVAPVLLQWRHRQSQEIHWSWVNAMALKDANGVVDRVLTTSQNVTSLKRAEKELKESEERFRHLSEAALEGIALIRDGRIVEVNNAFGGMFGLPAAFFKEAQPDRFFTPDTLPLLRRALSGDGEESFEGQANAPGGKAFPVLIRGRKGAHEALQVLAVRNLTAEKRLEEETRRLFQLSPDLLCVVGPDGRFKRLSPSWEKTLGFSLEELQAGSYADFLHPEDLAASNLAVEKLQQGRNTSNFENRYRCKDGSWRWIQWNGCLLPDGRHYLGMGRDVSAEKRRQKEFAETQQQVSEQIQATKRALLRVIRVAREALKEKPGASAQAEALLDQAGALMGWDRGEAAGAGEEFDYGALLEVILAGLAAETGGERPKLLLDAGAPRLLRADAGRLRDFLARLLRLWNAAIGRPWRLTLRLEKQDEDELWIEHELKVTGDAKTPATRPLGSSLDPESLLLLCGAWIRKWGGRMREEASVASFRFSLAFPVSSPQASDSVILKRPCALLVEDHPINQRMMLEMLARLGPYRVLVANTGQEAVRAAGEGPDVILMDCRLPGWDGYEAARRIRAEEEGGRHVPIIALTADAMDATRARCLEAGMDDFLTKPVLMQDLSDALARWSKR